QWRPQSAAKLGSNWRAVQAQTNSFICPVPANCDSRRWQRNFRGKPLKDFAGSLEPGVQRLRPLSRLGLFPASRAGASHDLSPDLGFPVQLSPSPDKAAGGSLKPLLEKRRRARINQSLSQLKGLILPLLGRENSNCSKLEKADVLEMTVRFLQELPALSWPTAAPVPCDSYREGYSACVARLARVLPACRVLEPAVSARLLEHLWRRAASATLDGGRAGDSGGPSAPAPTPASAPQPASVPVPSPPSPPCGPGLWRPW
uniref:Hes family bHLH transcription factor 2 n=1 Tax=Macaca mulatta TaxID=9544 RepID=A0A5F7ZY98_MACMU